MDVLRAAVREVKRRHPFHIDAFVVLPDHLHAMWTLPEGDADFAMRWMLIKAGFHDTPPKANAAMGNGITRFFMVKRSAPLRR